MRTCAPDPTRLAIPQPIAAARGGNREWTASGLDLGLSGSAFGSRRNLSPLVLICSNA